MAVTDSGSGIAPHHLPRLFDLGFSGSGTTSGLGLAVCKRLVTQLGGVLHVSSRLGHGSTFTLELAQAWIRLIVDDEPGLRLGLRANFLRLGYQVETASGYEEARSHLERARFHLVICDMQMSDGEGFAVLREFVRRRRNQPFFS